MTFDYEEFKAKQESIFKIENENKKNEETVKKFQELLTLIDDEQKPQIEEMITNTQQKIFVNQSIIQENRKYISEHQSSIGKEIKIYLDMIKSEIDDYNFGSNKSLLNLKECMKTIYEAVEEINTHISLIEGLTENKNLNNTNSFITKPIIQNKDENSTGDNEFPKYLISKNYEFSSYLHNNKTGNSLKSFFHNHEREIKQVMSQLNNDKFKTIKYLQKIHGLCVGSEIQANTINPMLSSIGINKRQTKLFVKINGNEVLGSSDTDIFTKTIEELGIETIYNNCIHIFSTAFKISKTKLNNMHSPPKEYLLNNQIYYLYINSNTQNKYEQLKKIKYILKLDFESYIK